MTRQSLWIAVCFVTAVTAWGVPTKSPTHTTQKKNAARRAAPLAAPALRETLAIETVPPVVIERAQLSAERGSTAQHLPPPIDAAPASNSDAQGQIVQITPTTIQMRHPTSGQVKTLQRGSVDLHSVTVGATVRYTTAPGGEQLLTVTPVAGH